MGVVNTKATAISNADATPRIPNTSYLEGAPLIERVGTAEVAAADSDTSTYRMCRIKSSERVSQILLANDAITGGTDYDIGLYDTDGGAAVDADLFGSAVDCSSARAQLTDLTHESASNNIADIEKRVWELLSLSADPLKSYDVVMTGNTVGTGAGTLTLAVRTTT